MRTYVLVPGAWLGGWAWDEVATRLREAGHEVHAVTLPGLGDESEPARDTDLETYISAVVDLVDGRGLSDVVLVGHSYSGIVVSGAADRLGSRLAAVVYVDTAPFLDGEAYLDVLPPEAQEGLRAGVEQQGEGWLLPPPPLDGLGASTRGLDEATQGRVRGRMRPQPFATWTQPLRLRGKAPEPGYRRLVIACDDLQALRDAGIPRFDELRRDPWEWLELDTGHWPMLSAAGQLAEILARIGGPVGVAR